MFPFFDSLPYFAFKFCVWASFFWYNFRCITLYFGNIFHLIGGFHFFFASDLFRWPNCGVYHFKMDMNRINEGRRQQLVRQEKQSASELLSYLFINLQSWNVVVSRSLFFKYLQISPSVRNTINYMVMMLILHSVENPFGCLIRNEPLKIKPRRYQTKIFECALLHNGYRRVSLHGVWTTDDRILCSRRNQHLQLFALIANYYINDIRGFACDSKAMQFQNAINIVHIFRQYPVISDYFQQPPTVCG